MKQIILTVLAITSAINFIYPCSAIVLKNNGQVLLGKNFDWTFREGMIVKNLRGVNKAAYCTHTGEPAQWKSKYGSVTFNQNGKEMPYGGMNEKGLVVEMLWLELTRFNINDEKKYVNELEWIQYQLDNYKTVQEVTEHLNDLKVYPIKGKIHYILADSTGESIIVEYLNGKAFAYKKEPGVCQAITNWSVIHSEPYKNQAKGLPRNNAVEIYRYYKLEQEIAGINGQSTINESFAFDILENVTISKGDFKTRWSIVYNIGRKSISFFTDSHKEIKTVDISNLDFDKDLVYFNLNQNEQKNLNRALKPLTEAANLSCASASLMHLGFDEAVTQDISRHQFLQQQQASSIFSSNYFHFEISIPGEEEKQTGFIAVMDSEQMFNKRKAITGGFLYGSIGKGIFITHIYGIKNGKYSMLAFIDDNKNRKLDFDDKGIPIEKYATFGNNVITSEQALSFSNTSSDFSKANAKVSVTWRM